MMQMRRENSSIGSPMATVFETSSMSDVIIDHFKIPDDMSVKLRHHQPEGVTLRVLNALVEEFGGKDSLRNMSIGDIRDHHLAPRRKQVNGSFLDYLKSVPQYKDGIHEATIFVSYNLGFFFVDFVESLNRCFEDDPDKDQHVLFITTLSNNFTILSPRPGEFPTIGVMAAHIATLVEKFQRSVLVLCQWEDPHRTPFTRLWCLLEMFQAALCRHQLDIATYGKGHIFSNKPSLGLDSSSSSNAVIDEFIKLIDIRQARTYSAEYNAGILGFVKTYIGIDYFNKIVINFIVQSNQTKIERLAASRAHLHHFLVEDILNNNLPSTNNVGMITTNLLQSIRPSLVLDLDDTLYSSSNGIMKQMNDLNDAFIRKNFDLDPNNVNALTDIKAQLHKNYGQAASFLLEESELLVEKKDSSPSISSLLTYPILESNTETLELVVEDVDSAVQSTNSKKRKSGSAPRLTAPKSIRLTSVHPEDPRLYAEERTTPRAIVALSRQVSDESNFDDSMSNSGDLTNSSRPKLGIVNPLDYYDYLSYNMNYSTLTPNHALRQMLLKLSEHVNLVLFSNAHYQHVSQCLTSLDLNNIFDYIIHADFSDVNFPVKPQIEAFERVERILGLNTLPSFENLSHLSPDDSKQLLQSLRKKIFYIDDSALNVTIAESRGWHAARLVEDEAARGRAKARGESGILSSITDLEQLDVFKQWYPKPIINPKPIENSNPSTVEPKIDLQKVLHSKIVNGEILGMLKSHLGDASIDGPENCPAGTVYYEEFPEVFTLVTEPYYSTLPIPMVVDKVIKGQDKFFNRCARRGLVKFITCENGFGAFLVKPNPGYHCETSYLIKQVMQKKLSEEVVTKARQEEEAIALADPFGEQLRTDEGFAYVAWWIPPSLVERTKATLQILQTEKERGYIGDDFYAGPASSEMSIPADITTAEPVCEGLMEEETNRPKKKLKLPMNKRLKSTVEQVEDYGLGDAQDESTIRDCGYLHTLKSLTTRDIPLLEALRQEVWPWLEQTYQGVAIAVNSCGFHYPYTDFFSTLHIHIRGERHPHDEESKPHDIPSTKRAPVDRGMYLFDNVIESIKLYGNLGNRVSISGCLTKKMLNWFDKLKANAPFAHNKLDIQSKTVSYKPTEDIHATSIMVAGFRPQLEDKSAVQAVDISAADKPKYTLLQSFNSSTTVESISTCDGIFPVPDYEDDDVMMLSTDYLFAEWVIRAHEKSAPSVVSRVDSNAQAKQSALKKALLTSFDDAVATSAASMVAYRDHLASIQVIAVIGAPGIGKNTTLAPLCASRRWIHLSSGDLMRSLESEDISGDVDDKPTIGKALKSLTQKAKQTAPGPLRDRYWDKIFNLMTIFIAKYFLLIPRNSVVVLDNYPRTVTEFTSLMNIGIHFLAYVEVTLKDSDSIAARQTLVNRMTSRGRGSIDKDIKAAHARVKRYFDIVAPDIESVVARGRELWQKEGNIDDKFPFHRIALSGEETPSFLLEQILRVIKQVTPQQRSGAADATQSKPSSKIKRLPLMRVNTA